MGDNKIKYYRGNINLLSANESLEYTEEQIEEIIKCTNDYEYFIYNYVKIRTKKGLEKPEVRDYQRRMLDTYHNNNRCLTMAGRQCGKSITAAMYLTWYLCFHSYKIVGIVANKEKVAKLMLSNIKNIFVNLPIWMKPGVDQWGTTEIKLDNNSGCVVAACSADALTGYTLNILVVDEISKIPKNKANDFFDSVLPTVEADENAKIIGFSTPKGLNIWYKMWTEAEQGISGYVTTKVEWNEPPGRDEKWKAAKIAEKGEEYFNQEFACEFIGSSSTLIKGDKLRTLTFKKPIKEENDGKFKIYEFPKKDNKYVAICDVGEGLGKDYSTIQVINITNNTYEQVAVYRDNEIKPFSYHIIIEKIAKYYNTALVVIERNSCGAEVVNNLYYELDYENIYYGDEFGLRTTAKLKRTGCSNFKYLVESDMLRIYDYQTINEISRFVYDGKTFKAQDYDDHDDLVMPLILFSWLALDKVESENWLDVDCITGINNAVEKEVDEFLVLMDYTD
mgnify:CR=1 FL=1